MQDAIETIRAALTPGADSATKARAATLLRAVLALLEAKPVTSATAPPVTLLPHAVTSPPSDVMAVAGSESASSTVNALDTFFERLAAHVPAAVRAEMPRFRVPLVVRPTR